MRLVARKYENGETFAVETTDDGASILKEFDGERRIGSRISAYAELLCDETVEGADRLLSILALLKEEVEKRKKAFAPAKTFAPVKRKKAPTASS